MAAEEKKKEESCSTGSCAVGGGACCCGKGCKCTKRALKLLFGVTTVVAYLVVFYLFLVVFGPELPMAPSVISWLVVLIFLKPEIMAFAKALKRKKKGCGCGGSCGCGCNCGCGCGPDCKCGCQEGKPCTCSTEKK